MNPIAIDLGFIKIYWYSITMLLAILTGALLFLKESKKQKLEENFIYNTAFYTILFGIIGARLYYVLFNFSYYIKNPIEIIEVWNGGLAIHGAIIAGVITIAYHCNKNKVSFLRILDIASPAVIIAQAIGRWGNFFNSEAHGPMVSRIFLEKLHLPKFIINGMYIDGAYYHPTFLYESIWNLLGFILLVIIRKYKKDLKPGLLIGIYLMWYSFARFFIEGLRTDSLMFGSLKMAQVISIVLFLLGAYLAFIRKEKQK